jgi:hypothetical protein
MKLLSSICRGSGTVNEDAIGWLGAPDDLNAAWVFDGVTGINGQTYLPAGSDAAWFVAEAGKALAIILEKDLPAHGLVAGLVAALQDAQTKALGGQSLPESYDPPAACLLLLRPRGRAVELIRLGDSAYVVSDGAGPLHLAAVSPQEAAVVAATVVAQALRRAGADEGEVMQRLRERLHAMRQRRNRPGGSGVLEADPACLAFIEVTVIEDAREALLCSDGYYRLCDVYGVLDPATLLRRSLRDGPEQLYEELRRLEASDRDCLRYPRIKPADDAAAICLASA